MTNPASLAPKPFVFVLMPFDAKYRDIYKFGIRGAAEDVGAYAERLDDQMFVEGMLDRIFNQISKADVVVADMTGRNPNVFYEVGYAHALGKIVILLTQDVNDIPFDFKHRQHIVYGGQIDLLRQELATKLQWAINESKKGRTSDRVERFSLMLWNTELREGAEGEPPLLSGVAQSGSFTLPVRLRNDGFETILGISHVYVFTDSAASVVPSEQRTISTKRDDDPQDSSNWFTSRLLLGGTETIQVPMEPFVASAIDAYDGLSAQFRLKMTFPALPPGAVEVSHLGLIIRSDRPAGEHTYRLRFHTASQFHEYRFRLNISPKAKPQSQQPSSPPASPNDSKETSDDATTAEGQATKPPIKRRRSRRPAT